MRPRLHLAAALAAAFPGLACAASPPPPAASCAALRTAYAAELAQAQACDPGAPDACAAVRPAALEDPCRCGVGVSPTRTARLDALRAQFDAQGCPRAAPVCQRACTAPATRCASRDGGAPTCGP